MPSPPYHMLFPTCVDDTCRIMAKERCFADSVGRRFHIYNGVPMVGKLFLCKDKAKQKQPRGC